MNDYFLNSIGASSSPENREFMLRVLAAEMMNMERANIIAMHTGSRPKGTRRQSALHLAQIRDFQDFQTRAQEAL